MSIKLAELLVEGIRTTSEGCDKVIALPELQKLVYKASPAFEMRIIKNKILMT